MGPPSGPPPADYYPMEEEIDWGKVARFKVDCMKVCRLYEGSQTSGCRTVQRNEQVGGEEHSKHTFAGGWGCAEDHVYELQRDRDSAAELLRRRGYHVVILPQYGTLQLHVQMFEYGDYPPRRPQ